MKVAVCVPIHRSPRAAFTESLARMLCNTFQWNFNVDGKPVKPVLETFVRSTSSVAYTRNLLADAALDWGADFLLWLDDDHKFPPQTLIRLLGHEVPVVAANYLRREASGAPVAKRDGELIWTTKEKAEAGGLEEVSSTGLGIMLVRADAVRAVKLPRFDGIHEDEHFCARLRDAGFKVLIDHALSWDSRHIGDHGLGFDNREGGGNAANHLRPRHTAGNQ